MSELTFVVEQETNGGFVAHAIGKSIITEAASKAELLLNVRNAVRVFFASEAERPQQIRLHYLHDEVIDLKEPSDLGKDIEQKLKGSVIRYDDPFGPAVPPEDWEVLQ